MCVTVCVCVGGGGGSRGRGILGFRVGEIVNEPVENEGRGKCVLTRGE